MTTEVGDIASQAEDRGFNDALAQRFPLSSGVQEACHRGAQHPERIIKRAKDSGQLRADFEPQDLTRRRRPGAGAWRSS